MEGPRSERVRDKGSYSTNRPAIGIFASPSAGEEIAGAILQAQWHGHDALVIHETDGDTETVQYAYQLDAIVINANSLENGENPIDYLTKVAKNRGYPGLIVQENPADRVNFDASVEILRDSDQYVTEAVLQPTADQGPDILVAIPSHNEESTIADVVSQAEVHADEVIVIDDGSTDDTVHRARNAGATTIEHKLNRGYGAALKTAFREAERCDANHLVVLDGDGQHDPADIPKLVETQKDNDVELVIGSRFVEGSQTTLPYYRRVGLHIVNLLTNLSLGIVRAKSRVTDTQSGFRVYHRRAIESLAGDDTIGNNMGASTDILHHAHQHDYAIEEVGTTIDYDVENASNKNPLTHGLQLIRNILRTIEQEHPISVLGVPGFISTLLGIGFAHLTFINYIDSGVFPLGLGFLASFFVLAGIFSCFSAIILHSLNQHLE